jgi:uncharacterized membrane protein
MEGNPAPRRRSPGKARKMTKGRLEAFSDGVLAILITIMVLELKVPRGGDMDALRPLLPVFLSYVLSFVYLGIYWNNHHHLLHATHKINGAILWANLHLLFWLSLVPVATGWMGNNPSAALPNALYGSILFMAGVAYWILQRTIIQKQGAESIIKQAVGADFKGKLSIMLYALAVALAFVYQYLADTIYILVALMWLIPDRRIERVLYDLHAEQHPSQN